MKPGAGHPSYRPDIDGLRALAILSVVGFHAFPAWAPGGFVGVDVFFVISGYLISGILISDLQKDRFSVAGFYARRIRRIFPALILVLAAALIFGFFILWPGEFRSLGKHAAGGAGFIVNILLEREAGYFDGQAETKPLLHLWSLGVEEQFYILWPLMLWAGWRAKRRVGFGIGLMIAASFAVNLWLAPRHPVADFYSPLSRFWELMAGAALAWSARDKKQTALGQNGRAVFSAAGLLLILVADFAFDATMVFPGWRAALPVVGACLVIAAGEKNLVNRYVLGNKAAISIGLISYPLYLWHWPLLSYAQILSGEAPSRAVRIGMIGLAFALAALTYHFVEKPVRRQAPRRKLIFALALTMILLGGTGLVLFAADGVPQRFADQGVAAGKLDSAALIAAWQKAVRMGSCHLQDPAAFTHAPDCTEAARPLLLLWGDSHAAALYPGLKALQARDSFGIAQLTQAGCPPLLDLPKSIFRSNCNALNRAILQQLPESKPGLILLAAAWRHADYPMDDEDLVAHIIATVAAIKQIAPAARVIVVGPSPHWLSPLPAIYRRALTFGDALPPMRSTEHLDRDMAAFDALLQARLAAAHIDYLSEQRQLCNEQGCLTRLGGDVATISFVDEEHLSMGASTYVVDGFAPSLLGALDQVSGYDLSLPIRGKHPGR